MGSRRAAFNLISKESAALFEYCASRGSGPGAAQWVGSARVPSAALRGSRFASTIPTAAAASARPTPWQRSLELLGMYKQLSKARLSMLVVSTACAGYVAGSEDKVNWSGLGWTALGTMLASSSANALNQAYEVVNDAKMKRTAGRPLPTGRMSRMHALLFAAVAGGAGVYILASKTNGLTATLGAANIALYAGVYTPLKLVSIANTWVGAVVGAVPPLMGWAAAAGSLNVGAGILAAGLYFWQLPHFMALAWLCRADYAQGGYRMLSLVDATGRRTAACALRNSAYLFPLGILATWLGVTTPAFGYESALITAGLTACAAKFYGTPTNANARLLFRASLLHLPIFMAAFLVHREPNVVHDKMETLLSNVRLLGFGTRPGRELDAGDSEGKLVGTSYSRDAAQGWTGQRNAPMYIPPLPFLPAPMSMRCPSQALCEREALSAHRPPA